MENNEIIRKLFRVIERQNEIIAHFCGVGSEVQPPRFDNSALAELEAATGRQDSMLSGGVL